MTGRETGKDREKERGRESGRGREREGGREREEERGIEREEEINKTCAKFCHQPKQVNFLF